MTGHEYQQAALRTATEIDHIPYGNLIVGGLGLAGESGEVADLIKKFIGQGHDLDRKKIAEELGDCLWYAALTAHSLGYSLDSIMEMNIEKLKKRYPEGFSIERSINREEYRHDHD